MSSWNVSEYRTDAGHPSDEGLCEYVTRLDMHVSLPLVEPMRPLACHPRSDGDRHASMLPGPCLRRGQQRQADASGPMRLVDDEAAHDGDIGRLQRSLDGHVHPGDGTGVLDGDQYPVACAGKDRLEARAQLRLHRRIAELTVEIDHRMHVVQCGRAYAQNFQPFSRSSVEAGVTPSRDHGTVHR